MHSIEEDVPPNVPEWFVTFADMMALLLAFFIMLASMGSFKQPGEFQDVATILRKQFGQNRLKNAVEAPLAGAGGLDNVPDARTIGDTKPGGIIYFAHFETELTEDNKREVFQIVRQLQETDDIVEIRGHAAQLVIDPLSGIRDLWDLADRRCHAVMRFMLEQGVDSARIRLANAGAGEPLYNGTDAVRLRENSRVEIRIERDDLR